jgi:hypothetical protein
MDSGTVVQLNFGSTFWTQAIAAATARCRSSSEEREQLLCSAGCVEAAARDNAALLLISALRGGGGARFEANKDDWKSVDVGIPLGLWPHAAPREEEEFTATQTEKHY